ncbi:MAG: hypothetical protein KIT58_06380 [Planctomycetota bacterium]|nr:hypothetical protein [Planctomycetota bacterium]
MAQRQPKKKTTTQRLVDAAAAPVKATDAAVTVVQTTRERVNAFLLPWALRAGWLGMSGLVVCAGLAVIDPAHWPAPLDEDDLPVYAVACLVAASLLGWGCVQAGVRSIRGLIGGRLGGWLFVLLPLACAVLVLLQVRRVVDVSAWPQGEHLATFARWYPATLVALGLVAYTVGRVRADREPGRFERGAWVLVLLAPYALLMAHLVVRVELPWLAESLEDTVDELGTAALVLQVVMAYFVSSSAAGS